MDRFYDLIRRYGIEEAPKSFPEEHIAEIQATQTALLGDPVIIAADNVVRYFEKFEAGFSYDFTEDCPNVAPPFSGGVFLETSNPGVLDARQGSADPGEFGVQRWGLYLDSLDFADGGEGWESEAERETLELTGDSAIAGDRERVAGGLASVPRWHVSYALFIGRRGSPKALGPLMGGLLGVCADGSVARWNDGVYVNAATYYGSGDDNDGVVMVVRMFHDLCFPLFLAVSFAHCKNIVMEQVIPQEKVSKKARKRNSGSRGKDRVRYHVLPIEPMTEVLRTEGNAEEGGLKQALHITRGHFKHYTPERGGLFGRAIDKPETVWVSQHVRGTAKQGRVTKDYRVEQPSREPAWGPPHRRSATERDVEDRERAGGEAPENKDQEEHSVREESPGREPYS